MNQAGITPLLLLLLLALPALAQQGSREEPREDRTWYRVELIVFANRDPDAALAEAWPPLPELAYPEKWRGFEDGETTESADREFALLRIEDTVPGLFELFWDRSVESLIYEYDRKQLLREPSIELEPLFDMTVPRPFVLLPPEARELNAQRSRINNSAGLDVLFHESWLQRIDSRDQSLPLIIDAGPRFGDYPELQGSVLLYGERYLHIASNLWLNTSGSYLAIDGDNWRMPPPPLPPDQARPEFKPFRVDPSPDWLGAEPFFTEETVEEEQEDLFEPAPHYSAETADDISILDATAPEDAESGSHAPATEEELQAFLAEPIRDYDFRHAVLVNQERRMRSGELHYIDHPLLGIVIKVSRYEFEPFITAPEETGPAGAR